MKHTKRHRLSPFNPYDIMGMTSEKAVRLLWVPKVLRTVPWPPHHISEYAIAVTVDDESEQWLTTGNKCTWLELFWSPRKKHATTAPCKVHLNGIDDSNYGAWLTARTHQEYVDTWHKLLAFLDECGAKEFGVNNPKGSRPSVNGEYLLDYCDEHLGAYERDYN